jgi:hypothetical protein
VRRIVPEYEQLLARGVLRPDAIITARYPLEAGADAYPALADPQQLTGVILMPRAPSAATPATPATATTPAAATTPTTPTPTAPAPAAMTAIPEETP